MDGVERLDWVPFEQFSASLKMHSVSQSTEAGNETGTAATATTGESCPTASSGTYSGGNYSGGGYSGSGGYNGPGYAGYGWSWGSGTAFRSGPGARF